MLDIIIPAFNAHETLSKTLLSLYMQTMKDKIKVYIVDDYSKHNYHDIVSLFHDKLDITELRMSKNGGPGLARQYGIDNSYNEYIMFIDSDDVLYDCFAIENLLFSLKDDVQMVVGVMYEEREKELIRYSYHQGCLHGKVYSRKLMKKYDIHFNSTRFGEDDGFNKLYLMADPKIVCCDKDIYLYRYNPNSITHQEEDYFFKNIEWFIYNMLWAIDKAEQEKMSSRRIAEVAFSSIYYVYFCYLYYLDYDKGNMILLWCKDLYPICLSYKNELTTENKIELYEQYGWWYKGIPPLSFTEFMHMIEVHNGFYP